MRLERILSLEMMMRGMKLLTKDIFIDTDCISAFLWAGNESLLSQLYPGRIVMPKPVYDEIDRPTLAWMKARVDSMIIAGNLTVVDLTSGTEEFDLYYKLTESPDEGYRIIGAGEASSIALAKAKNGIVASNNFNDILMYINKYSLEYTTTACVIITGLFLGQSSRLSQIALFLLPPVLLFHAHIFVSYKYDSMHDYGVYVLLLLSVRE